MKPKQGSTLADPKKAGEPRQRRPNRQRFKKQVTVRVDEDLLKAAYRRMEDQGLRLTDAIERGLWLFLQEEKEPEHILRGRFLWNVIPLELQRRTLGFWTYSHFERSEAHSEVFRQFLCKFLDTWVASPEHVARLEQLGSSPQENSTSVI